MTEKLSRRTALMILLSIVLAGVVFGSVSLLYPFGRDQGIYAYAGDMLLHGKVNYKYVFDLKPPGVHYAFALSEFFLGHSMLSFRIFDLIWQIITAVIIFLISYRFSNSKKISLIAPVLYLFLYYRYDYWHTLQADGLLNFPFALSILVMLNLREGETRKYWLISGMLFAVTILFKYTLLIFLPFLILCFIIFKRKEVSLGITGLMYYFLGFISVIGLVALFYILNHAFEEFYDVMFRQIPHYSNIGIETTEPGFIFNQITGFFFSSIYSPLILFSTLNIIYVFYNRHGNYKFGVLIVWLFSVLINLIIQWKFFYYHFLVIIPPLSVFTSLFFFNLSEKLKHYNRLVFPVILFIFLVVYFAAGSKLYIQNYKDLKSFVSGEKELRTLYIEKGFTTDSAFMIGSTLEAVDLVKATTYENDKIFIWGFDPVVYYLSGRESCSRFIYNYPLFWKGDNTSFRKELMNELEKCEPRLILVSTGDPLYYISGYNEDSNQMLSRFPELKSYLDTGYVFLQDMEKFLSYEKRK